MVILIYKYIIQVGTQMQNYQYAQHTSFQDWHFLKF